MNEFVKGHPASVDALVVSKSPDALKILFVGNRLFFWHDVPRMFVSLIKRVDPSKPLKISYVVGEDYTLQDHLDEGTAMKVIKQQGPWDFVLLQGKTAAEFDDNYDAVIQKFIPAIVASNARPTLFQNYVDSPADVSDSRTKFASIGSSLNTKILPLGRVWAYVRENYHNIAIYDEDGHHPSLKGSYLIASEFYAFFLQKPIVDLPIDLDYVDDTDKTKKIFGDPQEALDIKAAVQHVVP